MESEALKALFSHINSLNILPIAWPNTDNGEKLLQGEDAHLRIAKLNTQPETLTVCGNGSLKQWILQVNIYVNPDAGIHTMNEYADALCDGTPIKTKLTSGGYKFQSVAHGNVISPVNAEAWQFMPVQFRFQSIN